jgi:hypothetical protein
MKKEIRRIDTFQELSKLIQRRSKEVNLDYDCPPLSVNESGFLTKKIIKIASEGYEDFVSRITADIRGWEPRPISTGYKTHRKAFKAPAGFIIETKREMALDIIFEIFKDVHRWDMFSSSKKMMRRIFESYRPNDKA